jgi:hypothetical protein
MSVFKVVCPANPMLNRTIELYLKLVCTGIGASINVNDVVERQIG